MFQVFSKSETWFCSTFNGKILFNCFSVQHFVHIETLNSGFSFRLQCVYCVHQINKLWTLAFQFSIFSWTIDDEQRKERKKVNISSVRILTTFMKFFFFSTSFYLLFLWAFFTFFFLLRSEFHFYRFNGYRSRNTFVHFHLNSILLQLFCSLKWQSNRESVVNNFLLTFPPWPLSWRNNQPNGIAIDTFFSLSQNKTLILIVETFLCFKIYQHSSVTWLLSFTVNESFMMIEFLSILFIFFAHSSSWFTIAFVFGSFTNDEKSCPNKLHLLHVESFFWQLHWL